MSKLVLYNDDMNSFDDVILSLMEVLKHNIYQAEQCAIIVHKVGKCDIKVGSIKELEKYKKELIHKGLKIKIE